VLHALPISLIPQQEIKKSTNCSRMVIHNSLLTITDFIKQTRQGQYIWVQTSQQSNRAMCVVSQFTNPLVYTWKWNIKLNCLVTFTHCIDKNEFLWCWMWDSVGCSDKYEYFDQRFFEGIKPTTG
jgi:hypothetical protein